MYIEKIKLKNFRNYQEQEIKFNKNINVIEEINIDENRQKERYSLIIYFVIKI